MDPNLNPTPNLNPNPTPNPNPNPKPNPNPRQVALLSLEPLFVLAMAAAVCSCAVHMLGWMWLTSTVSRPVTLPLP